MIETKYWPGKQRINVLSFIITSNWGIFADHLYVQLFDKVFPDCSLPIYQTAVLHTFSITLLHTHIWHPSPLQIILTAGIYKILYTKSFGTQVSLKLWILEFCFGFGVEKKKRIDQMVRGCSCMLLICNGRRPGNLSSLLLWNFGIILFLVIFSSIISVKT